MIFNPEVLAAKLMASLGSLEPLTLVPLPGGRNNQVWRVDSGGRKFLLKHYFWSEQDSRDRFGQEWVFLHYLQKIGCRQAPDPLASDESSRCALLEFIEGQPLELKDVTASDVHAAADFFIQINPDRASASVLPPVSEACFSLEVHLATAAARIALLDAIPLDSPAHLDAREFVKNSILPLWNQVENRIRSHSVADFSRMLPLEDRCLSPSDFGFHNTLRQSDGTLRFFDFEYAGWDDPAKTIIDFCNQPDLLLPPELSAIFRSRAIGIFPSPQDLQDRIALLEPLYQLKWACICLNNFLPGRTFDPARPDRSPEAQLARACTMAQRAQDCLDSNHHRR